MNKASIPVSKKRRRQGIILIFFVLFAVDIGLIVIDKLIGWKETIALSILSGLVVAWITTLLKWYEEG